MIWERLTATIRAWRSRSPLPHRLAADGGPKPGPAASLLIVMLAALLALLLTAPEQDREEREASGLVEHLPVVDEPDRDTGPWNSTGP